MRASANRDTGPWPEWRPTAPAPTRLSEASDAAGEIGFRPALSASDSSEPDAEMAEDDEEAELEEAAGRAAVISEARAASEPDDEVPPSRVDARGTMCALWHGRVILYSTKMPGLNASRILTT